MFGMQRKPSSEFEQFLSPCLDGLYVSALRLTRNPTDAEDLVQDTAMRGYRFFKSFERGTNFRAWIFRILTNTFINGYRRQSKAKTLSDSSNQHSVEAQFFSAQSTDAANDPETKLVNQLFSEHIFEAIEALPVDFRVVVVLADLQEFSYKEIADMLDIPVGTVMSRLFRGRKQLQAKLRPTENEADGALFDLQRYREGKKIG